MKFFSISCCGFTMIARTTSSRASSSPEQNLIASPTRSGPESSTARSKSSHQRGFSDPRVMPIRQTTSELALAADPSRPRRRKSRRAKGSAPSTLQYDEWTPSLCTITEDNVGRKPIPNRRITIERVVKQKSGRESNQANQNRSHVDDYGQDPVTVIPAFAPTPFMF